MISRIRNFATLALLALLPASLCAGVEDDFDDHVEFKVQGQTTALTNFPLLVRVSEETLPGFKYSRAGARVLLAFTDADGNLLKYDDDEWHADGESLIWVNLPELPADGMTVKMYWSYNKDNSETGYYTNAGDVWTSYAGVWHMNSVSAATTNTVEAVQDESLVGETDGVLGKAYQSLNKYGETGRALLVANADEKLDSLTGGVFTVSFWTKLNGASDSSTSGAVQYLFSRRKAWGGTTGGYALFLASRGPTSGQQAYGLAFGDSSAATYYSDSYKLPAGYIKADEWMRHDVVFDPENNKFYWYANGQEYTLDATLSPLSNGTEGKLGIGGLADPDGDSNINGAMDEFRISAGKISADQIAAEIANVSQKTYRGTTTADFIHMSGYVTTNGANGVKVDYWDAANMPSISLTSWVSGTIEASDITITSGALHTGALGEAYKCEQVGGEWSTNETITAEILSALPAGKYKVSFRRALTAVEGFSADEVEIELNIADKVADFYEDLVDLRIKGQGVDLAEFPVLVRISPATLAGFDYSRVSATNLAFTVEGSVAPLSYDVDLWDESGESLVWVKLPTLPAGGTTITMYWAGDHTLPNKPAEVWTGYAGVWHMEDATDATTNAAPGTTSATVSSGVFGNALYNASNSGAPLVTVTTNDAINALSGSSGSGFVASFWLYLNSDAVNNEFLFARRERDLFASQAGYGVNFGNSSSTTPVVLYSGSGDQRFRQYASGITSGEWVHLDFVFAPRRYQCWVNGQLKTQSNAPTVPMPNGMGDLAIGGAVGNTAFALNGAMDEFRLMPYGANASTRIIAEHANMTQTEYRYATEESFIWPGSVVTAGVTNDYWAAPLALSTNTWVTGGITTNELTIIKEAALRSGGEVRYYYRNILTPETTHEIESAEKLCETLASLPGGRYKVFYASSDSSDAILAPEPEYIEVEVLVDVSAYPDWVTFTLNGIDEGVEITNYTMLVRVSEKQLPGFKYKRAGNGTKLVFVDEGGSTLYYDIDTWNPAGESIVWVNVPIAKKGSEITFYWGLGGAEDGAANDSRFVWSDYAGVWHFNEDITGGTAATTVSTDSTGNGLNAVPTLGSAGGDLTEMVSKPGVFGNARVNASSLATDKSGANHLVVTNSAALDLGSSFTFSGWVKFDNYSDVPRIISKAVNNDGWEVTLGGSSDRRNIIVNGMSQSVTQQAFSDFPKELKDYTFITVVYKDGKTSIYSYSDGRLYKSEDANLATITDTVYDLAFGGSPDGTKRTMWGSYDEFRLRKTAVTASNVAAEYANITLTDYCTSSDETFLKTGLVHVDRKPVDVWSPGPVLSDTIWEYGRAPDDLLYNIGVLRSGAGVTNWCENLLLPGVSVLDNITTNELKALSPGSYRIYNRSLGEIPTEDSYVDFTVVKAVGVETVGATAEGRILLMNNDASHSAAITGQGWANTNSTDATYWYHVTNTLDGVSVSNAMASTESVLMTSGSKRLWHLVSCRHGNTFPAEDADDLSEDQNYLPYNPSSYSIATTNDVPTNRAGAGQLLMQNTIGATVYSPCYDEGIGTIYFDAVNGWTNNILSHVTGEGSETNNAYRLVVEFATNTVVNGVFKPLTEKDSHKVEILDNNEEAPGEEPVVNPPTTNITYYANLKDCWRECEAHVVRVSYDSENDALEMTPVAVTNQIDLAVENGGTMNEFYRIYIPLDISGPVRFRIRRETCDTEGTADSNAYVLLDNIVASAPRVRASLSHTGWYDSLKRGKQVLGYEGAFEPMFPSVGDDVHGKAVATYYTNHVASADVSDVFASAKMHYRWRYLNSTMTETWQVAELDPADGFKTKEPLDLPGEVGDVEFWYEWVLQTPYYRYVDYSGANLESKLAKLHSENASVFTNAAQVAEGLAYPSAGTDWFVRIRDGASVYEGVRVITQSTNETNCATSNMELTGDGRWRGYVMTPEAIDGGLQFRFEGVKVKFDENGSLTFTTNYWTAQKTIETMPGSAQEKSGDKDTWERNSICDALTGYIVFTYDENSGTIGTSRGDYQNFDTWGSASPDVTGGRFVGSSVEANGVSYGVEDKDAGIYSWTTSVDTNKNWQEDFSVGAGRVASLTYPRNVPFTEWSLSSGWVAQHGLWTYEKWEQEMANSEGTDGHTALQLKGCGEGAFSFISENDTPDGLGTVSFTARVAQFNAFQDFAQYYMGKYDSASGEVIMPNTFTNYTFATYAALTLDKEKNNYDGNGMISLVAYYHPQYGAYEVRVSRGGEEGKLLRFVLCKWTAAGGGMACKILATNDFSSVSVESLQGENGSTAEMHAFYISVQEVDGGTMIHTGISHNLLSTTASLMSSMQHEPFDTCVYYDKESDRLKHGTFGMLSRDCPGVFLKPICLNSGIFTIGGSYPYNGYKTPNKIDRFTKRTIEFPEGADAKGTYPNGNYERYYERYWVLPSGRTLACDADEDYWGFTGATNVTQKIAVKVAAHGSNKWETNSVISVVGFKDTDFVCDVHKSGKCDVKLEVQGKEGDTRLDVTLNKVELTKWNGEWTKDYDASGSRGLATNFVYTTAWITEEGGDLPVKAVSLQPTRASSVADPVSLRSSVVSGLSAFHITWRNADTNAVLLLQKYSDNYANVAADLISETKRGDGARGSSWQTVATLDFSNPSNTDADSNFYGMKSGGKTFFFNERFDSVSNTVLRIIVASNVVEKAIAGDTPRTQPNYGRVDIIESFVWDLPPYEDRGWSAWNFRTDGWINNEPSTWANLSDAQHGMSGLLNNTVSDQSTLFNNREYYRGSKPYIQSPTFKTNCIGSVEFRARLYEPVFDSAAGYPAVVSVYGATGVNAAGEPTGWEHVTNIVVDSSSYELKTAKLGNNYCAMQFAIDGVEGVTVDAGESDYGDVTPLRVALDDICIIEQPVPSIGFRRDFVRPFRDAAAITNTLAVVDINTSAEQPLLGESFGFQAELEINDIENEIILDDPSKPLKVYLSYYPSKEPWGWSNWMSKPDAVCDIELAPADGTNLVYRSVITKPESMCKAQFIGEDPALSGSQYRIVQYHLYVTYWDKSGTFHKQPLDKTEWSMPEWDLGFEDPNATGPFSAFTLLETLAPKQAWINEVNIAEKDYYASKTNQWIEVAVPSGVDMTGWLVRFWNSQVNRGLLFMFGNKISGSADKVSNGRPEDNGYSFYLSQSVNTSLPGAHATWFRSFGTDNEYNGELDWSSPYGFELVRPTGIIEHRVVIQGRNPFDDDDGTHADDAAASSGTNLVAVLNADAAASAGGKWIWGEKEEYNTPWSTVCVTNGTGAVHEDWSTMPSSPGLCNENQTIDPDLYIKPNGGYVWVTSRLSSGNISQSLGSETGSVVTVTMAQGGSTNIVFDVAWWYQLDCTVSPTNQSYTKAAPYVTTNINENVTNIFNRYELTLNDISNSVDIVASAVESDEVVRNISTNATAFLPAIMNWLAGGVTGDGKFEGKTITNAVWRGSNGSRSDTIDLAGMYCLDLDPTKPGWELWGGNKTFDNGSVVSSIVRTNDNVWGTSVRTNQQVLVWLMISNALDSAVAPRPPYRLQGLNNEKSDEVESRNWTSETFMVKMRLGVTNSTWFTMRQFIFDKNSFYGADATDGIPFSALIEVSDPNTTASPAYIDKWWMAPSGTPVLTYWTFGLDIGTIGVSTLNKEDTLAR